MSASAPRIVVSPVAVSASVRHVLVVDDDRLVRSALLRTLRKLEHLDVEDFEDGVEAIERARRVPFDLAILDFKMPAMDGVELGHKLREILPRVGLIFVTADPHDEVVVRSRHLRPMGVLPKPWNPAELLDLAR